MDGLSFSWLRGAAGPKASPPLLEVEDLTVKVGIRRVLEGFQMQVSEGDAVCVHGPNGSGKTTLLNAIAGLEPARVEKGKIIFCGREIQQMSPHQRASMGLTYMRQCRNVFGDLTVAENLRIALGDKGIEVWEERFSAWAAEIDLAKRASLLSGGEQQRLAWGMVVLRHSRLILADEPAVGISEKLDLPSNGTLLLTSHETGEWSETV